MNKKSQVGELEMGKVVKSIIILVLIAIVVGGIIIFSRNLSLGDIIPGYNKTNMSAGGNGAGGVKGIVFKFDDGRMFISDIYYSYIEGKGWYWAAGNEWNSVDKAVTSSGESPVEKNIGFIQGLQGKSFEDGVRSFLDRTLGNNEGGWFYNVKLEVYIGGRKISYDSSLLSKPDEFINLINKASGRKSNG